MKNLLVMVSLFTTFVSYASDISYVEIDGHSDLAYSNFASAIEQKSQNNTSTRSMDLLKNVRVTDHSRTTLDVFSAIPGAIVSTVAPECNFMTRYYNLELEANVNGNDEVMECSIHL